MNIDTEIGTENTDTRPTKETAMLPDTVTDTRTDTPAAPDTYDVAVIYLRGIDSFLWAAQDLISDVSATHEGSFWPVLANRLFLATHSMGTARGLIRPSEQHIDTYIADMMEATGHMPYIEVDNRTRHDAYDALGQAIADLEIAIKVVNDSRENNPFAARDFRLLVDARNYTETARSSVPFLAPIPVDSDSTVPF